MLRARGDGTSLHVVAPLLSTVLAQPTAVATLRRALATGRVHHAFLFDGPDGVGKELAAFGFAQALVCERRAPGQDSACGECSACSRARIRPEERRPTHPDIAVLERGLYEPAQIGRRTPETQDISIDQVRTLVLARAAFAPHEGRAKVFVVRRAEELSLSAANALLKTLEEPGRGTYFVLISSQPDALLPTIRSRTLRIRFASLPEDVILRLLVQEGVAEARARAAATMAQGSIELARALADPAVSEERDAFVARAARALEASDLGPALELAEESKKAKSGLDTRLAAFALHLAEDGRGAAPGDGRRAEIAAARHRLAIGAIRQLESNASAQLVVESMFVKMRGA